MASETSAKKDATDTVPNTDSDHGEVDDNYISLNVGGKTYCTSRTTLTRFPNSFFSGLLDCASAKDDQGNYVINRNPEIFRHVLNFMRNDRLVVPSQFDDFNLHLLKEEADYLMLDDLKRAVEEKLKAKGTDFDPAFMTVGLNVGGKIYCTSRSVLRKYPESFFSRLLDGVVPSAKDKKGNYMIDRDGDIFEYVLSFMCSGKLLLPESFDELDLLENEADFYLLEPLKIAISKRLEMVGYVINDRIFKLRKEDVLRCKSSLLADMANGTDHFPTDVQGNHVFEWPFVDTIDHIVNYIRVGGISRDITSDELRLLRDDARDLEINNIIHHCQSLEFMEQNWEERSVFLHIYHWLNGPCIAYINKPGDFLMTRRTNISLYKFLFRQVSEIEVGINGKASFGEIDQIHLLNGRTEGYVTVDEIVSYFTERVVGGVSAVVNRVPLDDDCTLIEVTV